MNILLVDDDVYVTEALQKNVDWTSLEIGNVYTAHSVSTAKKIIEEIPIHLVVCDIEMPKEDGFVLLGWIQEKEYIIKTILLTSYAEFEYATKAIRFNCFAYALKPICFEEMETTISKAIEAENEALLAVNYRKYYEEYGSSSDRIQREHFWEKLLLKTDAPASDTAAPEGTRPVYAKSDLFITLYIECYYMENGHQDYRHGMFQWNLKNLIADSFSSRSISAEAILPYKADQYLAVLQIKGLQDSDALLRTAQAFIQKVQNRLTVHSAVLIGNVLNLNETAENAQKFLQTCELYVYADSTAVLLTHYTDQPMPYQPPDFLLWESFVLNRQEDALVKAANAYLDHLVFRNRLDSSVLKRFLLDYIQMMISVLTQKNILIHNMENPFFSVEQINNSTRSLNYAKSCVQEMLRVVLDMTGADETNTSVVKRVREYIDQNLDKDVSRESLAKWVFLNPDYLARIFKKEVGESIGNYIISRRIEVAKEYLEKTNEQVNTIAIKVGYDNFSYFSKVFKTAVGVTPKEYKRSLCKEQNLEE